MTMPIAPPRRITAACRRRVPAVLLFVTLLGVPTGARADVVTDWNQITLTVGGSQVSRTLAMVHLAIFDAVNSIDRRYAPYHSMIDAPAGTSAEAAAAAAAHGVLLRRFPAQQVVLDAALAQSTAGIPAGAGKAAGLALGSQVAAALHTLRLTDNMLAPNPPYVPLFGPGAYQLTPPGNAAPINTGAGTWRPFVMTDAAQLRGNGPLPVTHPRYAVELDEVRAIGAVGAARTPDQTISALWHLELAPPAMNRIARTEAGAAALDLLECARLFALLNVAMADASTSVFEAKYFYNYWRPVTAIRDAASDGNPRTAADPAWTPFLSTPAHPEYPSAHSVIQWAGTQVLEAVFGQNYTFSTTSSAVAGVTRTFASFRDYSTDASLARIYGGIHFRTAIEEGARQGKQVGNWILEHALLPVR